MNSRYSTTIYIIFSLLLLASLALLFLRQPFIDYYRVKSGVSEVDVVIRRPMSESELINTEVLAGETLSSLTNQVTVFSFDDICGDSLNAPRPCVIGNASPFIRK